MKERNKEKRARHGWKINCGRLSMERKGERKGDRRAERGKKRKWKF